MDVDHETGTQFKVYAIGGHVRGKLDGKVYGLPEASATWHALEAKSHNDKSYKELTKKGLLLSKPKHFAQLQLYLHLTGLERGLYLAINKNTEEIYAERIRYDEDYCVDLLRRLESIILSARAPGKIAERPDVWPCVLCEHKAVCHGEAFARSHCRTCIHATPIIDHEATDAPWLCEKHGKTLSVVEQKAGCPSHLFTPDVVPGQQTDAGDDFVEYRLRNGETWRDGVAAAEGAP